MAAIDHTAVRPGTIVLVTLTNADVAYEVHLGRGIGAAILESKINAAEWGQDGTGGADMGDSAFTLTAATPIEVPLDKLEDGQPVKLFLQTAAAGTVVALTPRPR